MDLYERIVSKEEINKRFIMAVTAIMSNRLISSKTGLAESLGVKPAKFSEILNGRMNVGIDMIARMCDYYDVSPDWLLLSRGNNVFRQVAKQTIWVDDNNLNMKYTEDDISNSIPSEEPTMAVLPNATPISPIEESFIYKMYEKKDVENKALIEEIGGLKERIRQLESQQPSESEHGYIRHGDVPPPHEGLGSSETVKSVHTKKHTSGSDHTFESTNLQMEK